MQTYTHNCNFFKGEQKTVLFNYAHIFVNTIKEPFATTSIIFTPIANPECGVKLEAANPISCMLLVTSGVTNKH